MRAFNRLSGIAAPLPIANIDTDKIFPGRFLKTISREGLKDALFADLRQDRGFILNREPWRGAKVIVALENFGCGSSREHAPWALADYGLSCIVAPSFADIFYANCFKNGILPIVLPRDQVLELLEAVSRPDNAEVDVDLAAQTFSLQSGRIYRFEIDSSRKADLLAGRDEIDRILGFETQISAFEREQSRSHAVPPENLV
jgi:3-isopropylmalate/(R)-2-methylmalate dehydratase small subunit